MGPKQLDRDIPKMGTDASCISKYCFFPTVFEKCWILAKLTDFFETFTAVRTMEYLDTEGAVAFKGSEDSRPKSRAIQTSEQLRNHPDRIHPPQRDKGRVGAW